MYSRRTHYNWFIDMPFFSHFSGRNDPPARLHHVLIKNLTHRLSARRLPVFLAIPLWSALLCTSTLVNAQNSSQNVSAMLQQAVAYEAAGDYQNATASYRNYLLQKAPQSAERRHARLKLPVLQEAVKYGAGPDLQLYLSAMNHRADGNADLADAQLQELIDTYPGGQFSDDALYLRAYIALMDHYNYQTAFDQLQTLLDLYPQSRYVDTALFAQAIVFEQLGNTYGAIDKMTELRHRHTGVSVGGINWPRDEYMSRLWFERSTSRIEYLQQRAESASRLLSLDPYGSDGFQWQAELYVDGQTMTVLLNDSETTTDVVIKGDTSDKINAFSGIVAGQPDSWVRITIDENSVRGMISVYGERHVLTPESSGGSLSDFHTLLLGDIDGNVTTSAAESLEPPKQEANLDTYLRSIKQTSTTGLTPGIVNHVAMIGVVIDSKYNDYHGGRGMSEALSILNNTDGIFREQLGIALKVDTVVVIESRENDPMDLGSVTMETMMRNFRDYRLDNTDLGSDIGLATLFSGNKNSDSPLGLAWIGSACRTDGFDVSVVTPYKLPSLLSTHEIGHTMGGAHDSDTHCSSHQGHIMWPFLSNASGNTFSDCSKHSIAETMAANNCHVEAMDLAMTLDNVSANSIALNISNHDPRRAAPDATLTLSGPGLGNVTASINCSPTSADSVTCGLGSINPLQDATIDFQFPSPVSDASQIVATVEGYGFIDVVTNNNSIQTDIHGNLTPYQGPITSNAVSLASNNISNSQALNTMASAEAGMFRPGGIIALVALLLYRRKTARTSHRH